MLLALVMALFIGTFFGIITGMRSRGLLDTIIMRVIDVLMAFPFMVFAMVFAALWGHWVGQLLIAVVAVWWVPFARLARSIVLQVKNARLYRLLVCWERLGGGWEFLSCSPR